MYRTWTATAEPPHAVSVVQLAQHADRVMRFQLVVRVAYHPHASATASRRVRLPRKRPFVLANGLDPVAGSGFEPLTFGL